MTDAPGAAYALVRDELMSALAGIDDDVAQQIVPCCPTWTVKDVAAHLCGLNAELLADVQGGLGNDVATSRQVGDRAEATLADVLDEWQSYGEPLAGRFAANADIAGALMADLVVHVYDLVEVVGQPTVQAEAATPASAHRYVPRLQQRVAEKMNVALTVELADGTNWEPPQVDGGSAVTVATSPHDFLRGVTGRLTRPEVEAFTWSADPGEILDKAWNQYGPFRV